MIEHLPHTAIDKHWWDMQLLRSCNKMWYAQSWVLDLASPGWEALVDRDSGAIMPLTWRKKYGLRYLYQPYGLQQLGVFAPAIVDGLQEMFLDAVPQRFKYWDIYLNTAIKQVKKPDVITTTRIDQEIKLDRPAEEIRAAFGVNHRRNLKKARVAASYFVGDVLPSEFVALFERTTGARFGDTDPQHMRGMQELIAEGVKRGECSVIGIRKDAVLHAAACLIKWQGRLIWFKAASDEEGQALKAMFFLIDHAIGQYAEKEQVMDLAGSNDPNVARFNKGFGAESSVYLHLKRNTLPPPLKWFKK
ncbi:MAG: GNAT family N-acetyltransferase [Flavobacteriales bacterium]|nr:GNAT family N-acetyltransferase [Flavobacteriales bacterium]MBK6946452.1 GNAT family N-acetyltransferase [Flavobacteriales bacterium]MBK7238591.1 GNAT family N-acetyltransferase [Flavobacteriales bacterium]MBK7297951.1 GNAT family N-acetyltransferase [Flavobacteriales bacterium]MBK9536500.1 GNAT family N-acetyltransferase [Flavobacteriales bacterium]